MTRPMSRIPRQQGVVLLGLVVLLALGGLAAVNYGESAQTARQREKETQLLWVGQQFRQALESYYRATPGPAKHLPVHLEDLLRDNRFPQPVRHLRKLYTDPVQPDMPWGVMKRGNQIIGIYSQADGTPFKTTDLGPGLESAQGAKSYSDWRFMFVPRTQTAPGTPTAATKTVPTSTDVFTRPAP
jgi:type II secretory pathway pseudopilin PulG